MEQISINKRLIPIITPSYQKHYWKKWSKCIVLYTEDKRKTNIISILHNS